MPIISKKTALLLKFITVASGILFLVSGILENVHKQEENECEMTYMYEYPEYIPITLDPGVQSLFPKYSLMVYGEGRYADELRNNGPSGIPVLFIPGNAGSHKQVRSLGSVALRKTEGMEFHFNFFTVDFKEELTALRGKYLWAQTNYVHECIKVILKLYESPNNNKKSLILIGHSMGGVIARGLFMLETFDPRLVNTIITLATPNLKPPLMVDQEMSNYYSQLIAFWNATNPEDREKVMHLALASIGGGNRDLQVQSNLIPFSDSFLTNQSLSVITTAVPKVWLSTDHKCIVWCKQLVLAINRALVDMVDEGKVTKRAEARVEILKYHLLSSFSTENSVEKAKSLISTNSQIDVASCKVISNKTFFQSSVKSQTRCFLIKLTEEIKEVHAMYRGSQGDWIGECKDLENCELYTSIATKAEIIPSKDGAVKVMSLEEAQFHKDRKVILFKLTEPKTERLFVKVSYKTDGTISVSSPLKLRKHDLHLSNQRTFSKLELPFMRVPWFAYRMHIDASCRKKDPLLSAKLRMPWFREDIHKVFDRVLDLGLSFNVEPPGASVSEVHAIPDIFTLKESFLHQSSMLDASFKETPELHIWFDSKCNFTMNTSFDAAATVRQLFKFSYRQLLPLITVFALLHLAEGTCKSSTERNVFALLLCLLVLRCLYIPVMFGYEGFLLIIFETLIAYSAFAVLLFASKMLILTLNFLGTISRWFIFNPFRNANYKTLNSVLFYGEIPFLVSLSFKTSGGIALLAYLAIFLVKAILSTNQADVKVIYLTAIQVLLKMPTIVTWFKDLEEGIRSDYDGSSLTCAVFITGIYILNYCKERRRKNCYLIYFLAIFVIVTSILSSLIDICWTSQVLAVATVVHCICNQEIKI